MESAIRAMQFAMLASEEELMKAQEAIKNIEIVMPQADDNDDDDHHMMTMTMNEMREDHEGGVMTAFDNIMEIAGNFSSLNHHKPIYQA